MHANFPNVFSWSSGAGGDRSGANDYTEHTEYTNHNNHRLHYDGVHDYHDFTLTVLLRRGDASAYRV